MNLLWTWVGAGLGLALGHSFGALVLGALIGWIVDTARHQQRRMRAQRAFVAPLFALLGVLAKSDGRVSQAEIDATERMMQRFDLDAAQRAEAIGRFNAGKQSGFAVAPVLAELRRVCAPQPQLAYAVLDVLAEVAYAEGMASPAKFQLLQQAAHALGFSEMHLLALLMMRGHAVPQGTGNAWRQAWGGWQGGGSRPGAGSGRSPQSSDSPDPYAVLGVSRGEEDASIKRAYRKLISQYHPDRLGDMPAELRHRAERRASEINAAWEAIKAERGIV